MGYGDFPDYSGYILLVYSEWDWLYWIANVVYLVYLDKRVVSSIVNKAYLFVIHLQWCVLLQFTHYRQLNNKNN